MELKWFVLFAVLFSSVTLGRSGSNITSCNTIPGSPPTTCNQGPYGCVNPPCSMRCGLKSSFETCQQHCDRSRCDTLTCTASGTCNQTCQLGQCKEVICNAPNCFQDCYLSRCEKMICSRNAMKCVQSAAAEDLLCEARSCDQNCSRGFCNATCSSSVKTCTQQVDLGQMNMTCAPGVETCTQTSRSGSVSMICNADVCKQNCSGYQCKMICSSSVKECQQICGTHAACRLSCKAASCKSDCPAKQGSLGCTPLTLTSLEQNITSCNSIRGSSPTTCNQGPCVKIPCVMQCGLKSSFETCQQHCDRSQCDTLNCVASGTCNQTCQFGQCKEVICNAPNCFQDCYNGICDKMICSRNAVTCVQSAAARDLLCEARSCDQNCSRGFCNATCSSSVKTCTQQVDLGRMNMTCAPGVETCTQNSKIGTVVIMICGGDTCKQNCLGGSRCEMVCSSSVKECHQICNAGALCRLTCEAEDCKSDCPVKRGLVGCTFLKIKEKNHAPAFHLSVRFLMFLQSFIFMIQYL
ncbi:uncharacterized protein LOC144636030 [Oculina patagonica]